jgi:hypothetical protein
LRRTLLCSAKANQTMSKYRPDETRRGDKRSTSNIHCLYQHLNCLLFAEWGRQNTVGRREMTYGKGTLDLPAGKDMPLAVSNTTSSTTSSLPSSTAHNVFGGGDQALIHREESWIWALRHGVSVCMTCCSLLSLLLLLLSLLLLLCV